MIAMSVFEIGPRPMNDQKSGYHSTISQMLFCVALLIVFVTSVASMWWIVIVTQRDGLYAMGFHFLIAPSLGLFSLIFGIIPSAVLYIRHRYVIDRTSLVMTSLSFIVVVMESIMLHYVPLISYC